MEYKEIVEKLISGEVLNEQEATWIMSQTMEGSLTPSQIAGWLTALRSRKDPESAEEVAAFAKVMRQNAVSLQEAAKRANVQLPDNLTDTCGTGGDKSNLMNISTLSAIVLASQGIPVAKHGNKSVSSACGSADILESLGYPLMETPEQTAQRIVDKKFGFMFAPQYHPAMKYAGPVRRELGIRTVFNILGPLSNPAAAKFHVLGVFSKDLMSLMAEALKKLGVVRAFVVHSEEGLDEISPVKKTYYLEIKKGEIKEGVFDPNPLQLEIRDLNEIRASNKEEALEKAKATLSGEFLPGIEAVALNTLAALYLHDESTKDLQSYIEENFSDLVEQMKKGISYEF
ncbi:MAG: anthranilate phosphoribosyltransferase [Candidatus Hydrogenedentota bacterium]|nr:MAG: anthranilate phosphoribosyltransferase [Candidatus Hydrogenedentota bacterium]